jgi:hypothetical protein
VYRPPTDRDSPTFTETSKRRRFDTFFLKKKFYPSQNDAVLRRVYIHLFRLQFFKPYGAVVSTFLVLCRSKAPSPALGLLDRGPHSAAPLQPPSPAAPEAAGQPPRLSLSLSLSTLVGSSYLYYLSMCLQLIIYRWIH